MKKKITKIILIAIICFTTMGCDKSPTKEDQLKSIIEEGNYVIVDVRTFEEYRESHIKDAINIPYDQIDENIEIDKDKKVLVYCQSGKRSEIAFKTLKDLNYDVLDLGAFDTIDLEKE